MRHHRRHPLIDRIRDMLAHMEGKRLLEPPRRADFHTDQMSMAPPYRGSDPGRAPGPILSNEEIVKRAAEGQQGDGYDWLREQADSSSSAEPPKND